MEYLHGGDWAGFEAEYGYFPLDFSANINPLGIPDQIQKAICRAAAQIDRYPDPFCRSLCADLSKSEQVPPSYILCGNGAADLIWRVALAKSPQKALVLAPTFAEYQAALESVGCKVIPFFLRPEENFHLTPLILSAITTDLDLVFLCEPNNPTGQLSSRSLLLDILRRCEEKDVLLIVDECFQSFLDEPDAHTLKTELPHTQHLMLLKAFTKLYAMAGVRLGYALCSNCALLSRMQAAAQPWPVSSLAQEAGRAALREDEYVQKTRQFLKAERAFLKNELRALGISASGEANYLFFFSPVPLTQALRQRGILIRDCSNYQGLSAGFYRIAVRTRVENEHLLQALREVLSCPKQL